MKLNPTRVLAVIGAALVLMIGGAVAYAQIPSANGTLTACFVKSTGIVRIIDGDTGTCKKGETKIVWSQQGTPGTDGADGADGVSGYEKVTQTQAESSTGFFGSLSADCSPGKKVTGGGAIAVTTSGGVQNGYKVINSSPQDDSSGWRASFDISNPLGDDFVLKVYALCAAVN